MAVELTWASRLQLTSRVTAHGSFFGELLEPVLGFCPLHWREPDQVGLELVVY